MPKSGLVLSNSDESFFSTRAKAGWDENGKVAQDFNKNTTHGLVIVF